MNRVLAFLISALSAMPAAAQDEQSEKTEIYVDNRRTEAVTMQFAVGLKSMSWKVMEQPVGPGEDLTYRFPVNLPACESLEKLGIKGVVTIVAPSGIVCQQDVRLCNATKWQGDVRERCDWFEGVRLIP